MVTYGVCLLKGFKRGLGGSKEKWFRGAICSDSKVLMALRLVKSQAKIPRQRNKLFNQKKAWLKVSFLEDFPVINGTCTCLNRSQMTISKVFFQKMVSIKAKKVSMGTKWRSWVFCVSSNASQTRKSWLLGGMRLPAVAALAKPTLKLTPHTHLPIRWFFADQTWQHWRPCLSSMH